MSMIKVPTFDVFFLGYPGVFASEKSRPSQYTRGHTSHFFKANSSYFIIKLAEYIPYGYGLMIYDI